jgi:AraC-like DNA-binding protein
MLQLDRIPIATALAAMQELVKNSGRTDLGFIRGLITHVGMDHVALRLLLSAPTLRSGLRTLAPYMPLVSAVIRMQCRDEHDALVVEWSMARPMPYEMSVIALETVAVSLHRQLLFLLQEPALSYGMQFSWPPPRHAARYRELKSPRVMFGIGGSPTVRMRIPNMLADRSLPLADERALREANRHAGEMLRELARERSFAEWVRHVLATVEDERLGQEQVARLLRVSGKTLSRYLAQEGARFGAIAQDVRRSRAEELLVRSGASVADIAHRLGYSTPANFIRAFKAKSGMTPAQLRRVRTGGDPSAPLAARITSAGRFQVNHPQGRKT